MLLVSIMLAVSRKEEDHVGFGLHRVRFWLSSVRLRLRLADEALPPTPQHQPVVPGSPVDARRGSFDVRSVRQAC